MPSLEEQLERVAQRLAAAEQERINERVSRIIDELEKRPPPPNKPKRHPGDRRRELHVVEKREAA